MHSASYTQKSAVQSHTAELSNIERSVQFLRVTVHQLSTCQINTKTNTDIWSSAAYSNWGMMRFKVSREKEIDQSGDISNYNRVRLRQGRFQRTRTC